jgi:hypothetical protein
MDFVNVGGNEDSNGYGTEEDEEESSDDTSMHDAIESAPSSQQSMDILNAQIVKSKGKEHKLDD